MAASAISTPGIIDLKARDRKCEMRARGDNDGQVCVDFQFLDDISIRDYPNTCLKLTKDEALRLIHEMLGVIVAKEAMP